MYAESRVRGKGLALSGKNPLEWKVFYVLKPGYKLKVERHVLEGLDKLCLNLEAVQNSDDKP